MKKNLTIGLGIILSTFFNIVLCSGAEAGLDDLKKTEVRITVPNREDRIDPMIYGQMLEDCSDRVIYDGAVGSDGSIRPHVDAILKSLNMPIVRWPGGTFVLEYQWERGIGPKDQRPVVPVFHWGKAENHQFGTDEFLAWCQRVGTVPYINFNANPHPDPKIGGSLEQALNWIEYVNGPISSPYGKKRAQNGHPEPYNVLFWAIGNEDWGHFGRGVQSTPEQYADRFNRWAAAIREKYPQIQLLGVGNSCGWDEIVLDQCGKSIDWITQHYYVTSRVENGRIASPESSTFAPAKTEEHLKKIVPVVNKYNEKYQRQDRPIRIAVDEWNNRHLVQKEGKKKPVFTRHDPRRLLDIAVIAGTLNSFIRLTPVVGMGNYIFPVNGHGIVRTEGDHEVYPTVLYPLFQLYRQKMIGRRLDAEVLGPGVSASDLSLFIEGDCSEISLKDRKLTYIDCAAALKEPDQMNIVLINRSAAKDGVVDLHLPKGFHPVKCHRIKGPEISSFNTKENRPVQYTETILNPDTLSFRISPCEFLLIECAR